MPHTNDYQTHQYNRTIVPKDINKDLEYWLTHIASDCSIKILDGEQETENDEETKEGRETQITKALKVWADLSGNFRVWRSKMPKAKQRKIKIKFYLKKPI